MEHRCPDEGAVAGWALARFGQPPPFPEYKIAMLAAGRLNDEVPVVFPDRLFDMRQVVIDILLNDPRVDRYVACRKGLFFKERRYKTAYSFIPFNGRLRLSRPLPHLAHSVTLI